MTHQRSRGTRRRNEIHSRTSQIHSRRSTRSQKCGQFEGKQKELSNTEKTLLLQEYKRKRYLKKLKGLHRKVNQNRLQWVEVQRRQKLHCFLP